VSVSGLTDPTAEEDEPVQTMIEPKSMFVSDRSIDGQSKIRKRESADFLNPRRFTLAQISPAKASMRVIEPKYHAA
jgi:hypothetical protein